MIAIAFVMQGSLDLIAHLVIDSTYCHHGETALSFISARLYFVFCLGPASW